MLFASEIYSNLVTTAATSSTTNTSLPIMMLEVEFCSLEELLRKNQFK